MIPNEYKDRLRHLFDDMSNEPGYYKLTKKTFLETALTIFIFAFLLFCITIGMHTRYPTQYKLITSNNESQSGASMYIAPEDESENQIGVNPNTNLIESRALVNLELLVFISAYIALFVLITVIVHQSISKNILNSLRLLEKEMIEKATKAMNYDIEIAPLIRQARILGYFWCFYVFEFAYHIEVFNQETSFEGGMATSKGSIENLVKEKIYLDGTESRLDIR